LAPLIGLSGGSRVNELLQRGEGGRRREAKEGIERGGGEGGGGGGGRQRKE